MSVCKHLVRLLVMLCRELIIKMYIFQAQYIKDCKRLYGRILDNDNVESSIGAKSKHQTEKVWTDLYPREPIELEHTTSDNSIYANTVASRDISYDLVSAVKRQTSFCYQVVT